MIVRSLLYLRYLRHTVPTPFYCHVSIRLQHHDNGGLIKEDKSTKVKEQKESEVSDEVAMWYETDHKLIAPKPLDSKIVEWEDFEKPRKLIFQEIRKLTTSEPSFSLQEAAQPSNYPISPVTYHRYPHLASCPADHNYLMRGVDNQDTKVVTFPELSDFVIVGGGLFGSAMAYYAKRNVDMSGDVVVFDKDPYSPHNSTAVCSGLISAQSKCSDIVRLASVTKELIRDLRNDVMVTDEDFAKINYRPVTHLILWPQEQVDEVLKSVDMQLEDGCLTETKTAEELETMWPWLKVKDSDVVIGTHGFQDEALVDPIALRNLYRTLAQAYGATFILAEGIDWNTCYAKDMPGLHPLSTNSLVFRNPITGELRNVHAAAITVAASHDTPFLESRCELETYMRDQISDLHFLRPRLRVCFSFNSLASPILNFPVITDTDGSLLMRDDYLGNYKYYLTLEEGENFLDEDYELFTSFDKGHPYPNLIHKSQYFERYFNNFVKPKLVNRIPAMEDANFNLATSGFENYNTYDGNPIISSHPHLVCVNVAAGFGPRMSTLAPGAAASLAHLVTNFPNPIFDLTNFYWTRVFKGLRMKEHASLIK